MPLTLKVGIRIAVSYIRSKWPFHCSGHILPVLTGRDERGFLMRAFLIFLIGHVLGIGAVVAWRQRL